MIRREMLNVKYSKLFSFMSRYMLQISTMYEKSEYNLDDDSALDVLYKLSKPTKMDRNSYSL